MRWIPGPLVRLFARPYVAGDSIEAGLAVAHELWSGGEIATTLDLLAEEVRSADRAAENLGAYLSLLERLGADDRFQRGGRPTVSVKLSSFTTRPLDRGGDGAGSREGMLEVAAAAQRFSVGLTIDMEDHHWTDFTLELAIELFERGFDVGTVLQSRLDRTDADVERIPSGMRVRTVIGIYPEHRDIATVDKSEMKDRLVRQSLRLLERGCFVEFASHDEDALRRFFQGAGSGQPMETAYEIQMLYGVPRGPLLRRIRSGRMTPDAEAPLVRLYVPFATDWEQATAYCRRRLAENPDLAIYVMRNLFRSGFASSGAGQYLGSAKTQGNGAASA